MRDAFANLQHRERFADLGFDDLPERRIGGVPPIEDEADDRDRFSQEVADVSAGDRGKATEDAKNAEE
jgi:hypothetical protein